MADCNGCGKSHRKLGISAALIQGCACGGSPRHYYCPGCQRTCLHCVTRVGANNRIFGDSCTTGTGCHCSANHRYCQQCQNAGITHHSRCARCTVFTSSVCNPAGIICGCGSLHNYCGTCSLMCWTCDECGIVRGVGCEDRMWLKCEASFCTSNHKYCSTCKNKGALQCRDCGAITARQCNGAAAKHQCVVCSAYVCAACKDDCGECGQAVCKQHLAACGGCAAKICVACEKGWRSALNPRYALRCLCSTKIWHPSKPVLKKAADDNEYPVWVPSCNDKVNLFQCVSCSVYVCADCGTLCGQCKRVCCTRCLAKLESDGSFACLTCVMTAPLKASFATPTIMKPVVPGGTVSCFCNQPPVAMPAFEIGALGEVLARALIPDELYATPDGKAADPIRDIHETGGQGVDLVIVTETVDQRKLLWARFYGLYPPTGHKPAYDFEVKDGRCLHFLEVKVNKSKLSKDQEDATGFVTSRLQNIQDAITTHGEDVDDGRFTKFVKKAAKTLQKDFDDPSVMKQYCLARIEIPKLPQTATFDQWVNCFEPNNTAKVKFQITQWAKQPSGTLKSDVNPYAFSALKVPTYMPYKRQGDVGEQQVFQYLSCLGFTEISAIQNKTGNGIDGAAKNPNSGKWSFFEIKSTTSAQAPPLTDEEAGQFLFVTNRILRICYVKGTQDSFSSGRVSTTTREKAEKIFTDVTGIKVDDIEDVWDKTDEDAREQLKTIATAFSTCHYYRVEIFLPEYGKTGPVKTRLFAWDPK